MSRVHPIIKMSAKWEAKGIEMLSKANAHTDPKIKLYYIDLASKYHTMAERSKKREDTER